MVPIISLQRSDVSRLIGVGVICLGVIGAPVTFDVGTFEVASKAALAKKGGDKGGGKGGGGRDRDRGERSHRSDKSMGPGGEKKGHTRGNRSLGEVLDDFRSGKAFGIDRKDHRIDRAKERYSQGSRLDRHRPGSGIASDPDATRMAQRFTAKQADELIGRGWKTDQPLDGFANHGDRVRTMVELAKALGYNPSVGALQANFGTPSENGIAALQDELAAARAEAEANPDAVAKVDELEAKLASAVEQAKPGQGPTGDWATADLDVNDDGVVDHADLAALADNHDDGDGDQSAAEDEGSQDDGEQDDETAVEASLN